MSILDDLRKTDLSRFMVMDIESTGLSQWDEILECSIIDQDGNVLIDTLVKPTRRKSWPTSMKVHNIQPADVFSTGIPQYELLNQVRKLAQSNVPLLAYNLPFDLRFFPDYVFRDNTTICVLKTFRALVKYHPSFTGKNDGFKLKDAANLMGVQFEGNSLHRAVNDCEITRQVMLSMLGHLKHGSLI